LTTEAVQIVLRIQIADKEADIVYSVLPEVALCASILVLSVVDVEKGVVASQNPPSSIESDAVHKRIVLFGSQDFRHGVFFSKTGINQVL